MAKGFWSGVGVSMVLGLVGCAPSSEWVRSEGAVAPEWVALALEAGADANGAGVADLSWREFFVEPDLQALIERALAHNYDLRQAALNVALVEAQYQISVAQGVPTLALNSEISAQRVAQSLSPSGRARVAEQYSVGLGVAGFELDFFGRVQAQQEAVLNQYLATREARDSAQIGVIASVAKGFYRLRLAQYQLALAQRQLAKQKELARLGAVQLAAGLVDARATVGAQAQVAQLEANLAQARGQVVQAENVLMRLVGGSVDLKSQGDLMEAVVLAPLPAGLPSKVLERRPDIREAEYQLQAAEADIMQARASFYPSIRLTGSAGLASGELQSLVAPESVVWRLAPSLSLPIFDGGQRRANLQGAEIKRELALVHYQQTVQSAFYEVAEALSARQVLLAQYEAVKRQYEAALKGRRLEGVRLERGVGSAVSLLERALAVEQAEQALLQAQLLLWQNRVDVYRVLGGGLSF